MVVDCVVRPAGHGRLSHCDFADATTIVAEGRATARVQGAARGLVNLTTQTCVSCRWSAGSATYAPGRGDVEGGGGPVMDYCRS